VSEIGQVQPGRTIPTPTTEPKSKSGTAKEDAELRKLLDKPDFRSFDKNGGSEKRFREIKELARLFDDLKNFRQMSSYQLCKREFHDSWFNDGFSLGCLIRFG
jgi:hypothetical protein